MRPGRRWMWLLLLYLSADFVDPSIPGVFFFDSDTLFVDGLVQAKVVLVVKTPLASVPPAFGPAGPARRDAIKTADVRSLDRARPPLRSPLTQTYSTAHDPSPPDGDH